MLEPPEYYEKWWRKRQELFLARDCRERGVDPKPLSLDQVIFKELHMRDYESSAGGLCLDVGGMSTKRDTATVHRPDWTRERGKP